MLPHNVICRIARRLSRSRLSVAANSEIVFSAFSEPLTKLPILHRASERRARPDTFHGTLVQTETKTSGHVHRL